MAGKAIFFERKQEYFWTVLVEYRAVFLSAPKYGVEIKDKKDEGYKNILSEGDWPPFKLIKEWRADRSKKGIPPYLICNNMQLARICVMRPSSLNMLQIIDGICKVKCSFRGSDRYGSNRVNRGGSWKQYQGLSFSKPQ